MANFLPEKIKCEVEKEYVLRISNIFLIGLFVILVVSICLLLPSRFLSSIRFTAIDKQLFDAKNTSLKNESNLVLQAKNVNEIVNAMSGNIDNKYQVSSVLEKTVAAKNSDIKITSATLSVDSSSNRILTIKGSSDSRDSLIMFVKDIKSLGLFSAVDFPVSNLINNSNVDFEIGLTLKK